MVHIFQFRRNKLDSAINWMLMFLLFQISCLSTICDVWRTEKVRPDSSDSNRFEDRFSRPSTSFTDHGPGGNGVKLAASIAMNPHYHPYSDISAQHPPPSPDSGNGFPQMAPGSGGGGMGHHMSHHHNGSSGPGSGGGGNNNNNNNTNNNNNNGPMTMDGQQNFQHVSNNMGPMKHCAGCGGETQRNQLFDN